MISEEAFEPIFNHIVDLFYPRMELGERTGQGRIYYKVLRSCDREKLILAMKRLADQKETSSMPSPHQIIRYYKGIGEIVKPDRLEAIRGEMLSDLEKELTECKAIIGLCKDKTARDRMKKLCEMSGNKPPYDIPDDHDKRAELSMETMTRMNGLQTRFDESYANRMRG